MGGKLPGMPALESSLTPWTVGAFGLVVVWALRGYLLSKRRLLNWPQACVACCAMLFTAAPPHVTCVTRDVPAWHEHFEGGGGGLQALLL